MLKFLKTLVGRAASPSTSLCESISAGHGLHRPVSGAAVPATLPPDRRGRLKNGNRPGDFLAAKRCGARTRCGGECRQPAMPNGRCRLHGSLSTGLRTPEGLAARSRRARLTQGARSAGMRALLREARLHMRRNRALRARLTGASAGHGVHRSNSTAASGMTAEKIHHRGHRDHRAAPPSLARAARIPPSSVSSVVLCGEPFLRWAWAPSLVFQFRPLHEHPRPSAFICGFHTLLRWAWGPSLIFACDPLTPRPPQGT